MSKTVKASAMAGSNGSFTMAAWNAKDVPVGSEVGIVAAPAAETAVGDELPTLPTPVALKKPTKDSPGVCLFSSKQMQDFARAAIAHQPPKATLTDEQISQIVRDVAELPDRDRPPDQPEKMLVSAEELRAILAAASASSFQQRVQPWMMACFGPMIASDREERNHRFLEEAVELVQACGCTASEAHQLVDYVYGRPVGDPPQEVGGVMVTLAALCLAQGLNMHQSGEVELARIWTKVEAIRAKQAAKPKHSPLPGPSEIPTTDNDAFDHHRNGASAPRREVAHE